MKHRLVPPVLRQWNPVTSVIVTVGGYFVAQVASVLVLVAVAVAGGQSATKVANGLSDSPVLTFGFTLLIYGIYVLIIRSFLKKTGHKLKDIGFKKPDSYVTVSLYVIAGFVLYFIAAVTISLVAKLLIPSIDLDQRQDLGFGDSAKGLSLVFVFLTLVIIPPFAEEIACRGFLYTGLRKKLPLIWAAAITSTIFAVAHLNGGGEGAPLIWAAAIDTFVLSCVLVYVREKTDNLFPAIAIHMTKHAAAFIALFIVPLLHK